MKGVQFGDQTRSVRFQGMLASSGKYGQLEDQTPFEGCYSILITLFLLPMASDIVVVPSTLAFLVCW